MSKKGGHPLLCRLLKTVDLRLSCQEQAECLRQQRSWLIDLDRLMAFEQLPKPTRESVANAVDHYLGKLLDRVRASAKEDDREAAERINLIFRNMWWGLFTCYEVNDLPRTNNDLEQFIRRIKTSQRRITGRKNVHDFILRYGRLVAFVDYAETDEELLQRLSKVRQEDFLDERNVLNMTIVKEQKIHRFRFHRQPFLFSLEMRWDEAFCQVSL
jgi:hypothetical protein